MNLLVSFIEFPVFVYNPYILEPICYGVYWSSHFQTKHIGTLLGCWGARGAGLVSLTRSA
mgnify:CR=1 FL=1